MPLDFNLNQKHGLNFKYQSICESLLLQFKRICRVNRFIVSLRKIRQTMNSPYPSTLLENAVNEFEKKRIENQVLEDYNGILKNFNKNKTGYICSSIKLSDYSFEKKGFGYI